LIESNACIISKDKLETLFNPVEIIFSGKTAGQFILNTVKNTEVLFIVSTDILENVQVLKLNKKKREEVLENLSNAAINAGYAKPGYYEAILKREEEYPTGLHTPEIEVAIPHADAEWANTPSLTIGLLEHPVTFRPMGGEGGDVAAEIVFMLTINQPKQQINFLRAFSKLMAEPQLLIDFKNTGDYEPFINRIKMKMG
jgi:PTS system galactitol-specific IIA component